EVVSKMSSEEGSGIMRASRLSKKQVDEVKLKNSQDMVDFFHNAEGMKTYNEYTPVEKYNYFNNIINNSNGILDSSFVGSEVNFNGMNAQTREAKIKELVEYSDSKTVNIPFNVTEWISS